MEIRENRRRRSGFLGGAEHGYFTLLLRRLRQRTLHVQRFITNVRSHLSACTLNLLFGGFPVAVNVVVCYISSLFWQRDEEARGVHVMGYLSTSEHLVEDLSPSRSLIFLAQHFFLC